MRSFVPDGASTPTRMGEALKSRERAYQAVIWALVIWNLVLQARSLGGRSTCESSSFTASKSWTIEPDQLVDSFVDPHASSQMSSGSARVVCSGCTEDGNISRSEGAADLSQSAVVDISSSNGTTMTNATAAVPSADASSMPIAGSTSPPPIAASKPPPSPAAAPAVAAPAAVVAVPTELRLAIGANCSSAFKGDTKSAQCLGPCSAKFARAHCMRCKCRACQFCTAPPAPA